MTRANLNKFSIRTVLRYLLYGAPTVGVGLVGGIITISGALSGMLEGVPDPHRSIYVAGLVVFGALVVIVATLTIFLFNQSGAAARTLVQSKSDNASAWNRTYRAIDTIVSKLYDIEQTRWKFTKVREVYTIEDDGTTNIERHYTVESGERPAQIWRVEIAADQSADRVEKLNGLDLEIVAVSPKSGERVEYLLYEDHPLHKTIAVFFLPEIGVGQERDVKVTYKWPGFARDLIVANSTVFELNYQSCDPDDTAHVEIEIRVSKNLGSVSLELMSAHEKGMLNDTVHSEKHTILKFNCSELGMNHRTLKLCLRRHPNN